MRAACISLMVCGFVLVASPAARGQQKLVRFQWDKTDSKKGATLDRRGETIIIGGNPSGPSGKGGYAEWVAEIDDRTAQSAKITISTNGSLPSTWGKGIHATRKEAVVRIYVNGTLVHSIVCDRRGAFGDYWPKTAPVGTATYVTPVIEFAESVSGPELKLKVVAEPHAVLDVNSVSVQLSYR